MTICIIDTSVFCNILGVPNRCQKQKEMLDELKQLIAKNTTLLLPLATIYETGNHIAQNGDGQQRRQTAEKFVEQLSTALKGHAPWIPTPLPTLNDMTAWLDQFPDNAMRGIGLGDLSIIQVFELQCNLHQNRRIYIWSDDQDLQGYDRPSSF